MTIMAHILELTVLNLDQETVVLMFAEDFCSHSVEGNVTASLCVPRSYKLSLIIVSSFDGLQNTTVQMK
jgi:hypothetical protein